MDLEARCRDLFRSHRLEEFGGVFHVSHPTAYPVLRSWDSGYHALCGDATDDECTNPDTCDGAGTCAPNHEGAGAACGDQGVECLVDDSCDGAGACPNDGFEPSGTTCGDPADTICDNPDSCDANGACQDNYEPVATE